MNGAAPGGLRLTASGSRGLPAVLRGLEALVCGAGIDTDLEENRMTLV